MTLLLLLATALFATWIWSIWKRDGAAVSMRDWNYVLLVAAVTCAVMAIGLGLR